MERDDSDRTRQKAKVLSLAAGEGIKWGIISTTVAGGGVAYGTYYSPAFNKSLSVSAKSAIPIMLGVFSWSIAYEVTMNSAHRWPERWGLQPDSASSSENVVRGTILPFHKKVANFIYNRSFEIVGFGGLALASKIFYDQLQVQNLTLSQRVMHSRIFAQAGVLSILLPVMAFREFMEKRGGSYTE